MGLRCMISDDVRVPFDKAYLQRQIESGGGTVLNAFDRNVIASYERCVLVSSTYQRTLKYLHCLAASIPCVSNSWVKDCCIEVHD